MKNAKFIYLYLISGVLFLILAASFSSTEDKNLTPVFASIGFSIITISFVLLSRRNKCKSADKNVE